MGYAEDLAEAQKMKAAIERYGVKVSIELQAGAGGSWSISTHRLIMSHHTASRPSQGLTPCLGIVKLGRPDVPGPLANGYMGYDGVYRILTFGRANHPGAGGPVTFDGVTVPRDNGRPYIWGTEFEGGYEPYSEFMHDRMARANAGITDYFADRVGATVAANLEHKTWAPLRKPDRIGYTREISIERINAVRSNPTTTSEEDDMFSEKDRDQLNDTKAKVDWLASVVGFGGKATQFWTIRQEIARLAGREPAEITDEDVQGIAVKVLAGLTPETVAAAVVGLPHDIAVQVADILAARLSTKEA